MPILNYTTGISSAKTVSEIAQKLARAGATNVSFEYIDGETSAVYFTIKHEGTLVNFRLPHDVHGVLDALKRDKSRVAPKYRTEAHASKVAWRIVKDWVEAQLAIIEAGQAKTLQVFLPYAVSKDGKTLYEHFEEQPHLLLEAHE